MDLNLSESQQILGKAAREFLAAECTGAVVRAMESDPAGYPPQLWRRIVEMGWPGVAVPEAYGGQGAGFLDVLVLLQEMGRAALPGPFFSSAVLAATLSPLFIARLRRRESELLQHDRRPLGPARDKCPQSCRQVCRAWSPSPS